MDLLEKPRVRDLVLVCLQPIQNRQQIKAIKKEAKILYTKVSKSNNKLLFQDGVWEGMRLIDFAVIRGHELLFNIITEHLHVNPSIPDHEYNRSPLHYAAQEGQNAMIEVLVTTYRCPIDAMDNCGSTPLNFALFCGRDSTLDLLLDHGASTSLSNFFGLPMHYAAFSGNAHAVKRLHEVNADSAISLEFGFCTPIVAAVATGSFKCIEFLAEFTDITGSPLMYKAIACISSEQHAMEIIGMLLSSGVDVNLHDEGLFEEVPIILAAKLGWRQVVEVLLNDSDPIDGVDWSIEGLIGHVNTEVFLEMDYERRQQRLTNLKARILQELENRHYLAAEIICQMLRIDMGKDTCYSWMCLCSFIRKFAEASTEVNCNPDSIRSVGQYCLDNDQLDMALVAAKACLVLAPEDAQCITFHQRVTDAQEAASSTDAQEAASSSGRL